MADPAGREDSPSAPRRTVAVRRARLTDLGSLVHLYRSQSEASRRFHHPYPFDRLRLSLLFLGILLAQPFARYTLRVLPNSTFLLYVACPPGTRIVAGYGSIRFVATPERPTWARYGYLVSEDARAQGIGGQLALVLYRATLALGVRYGGGTIQSDNLASRKVVERLGFRLTPTQEVDRRARGEPNLVGIEDVAEVLSRLEARAAGPATEPGA